jgi:hypothetical protein
MALALEQEINNCQLNDAWFPSHPSPPSSWRLPREKILKQYDRRLAGACAPASVFPQRSITGMARVPSAFHHSMVHRVAPGPGGGNRGAAGHQAMTGGHCGTRRGHYLR